MRYAYSITSALLLGGAAATLALQSPVGAQTAQNEPGTIQSAAAPRPGAPLSFADLAARLQPAVVNISTTQRVTMNQSANPFAGTPFGDLFGGNQNNGRPITREAQSLGSGFIISADGYVVTNNHVISADGRPGAKAVVQQITVTLPDRTEYKARLVGRDALSDLAVLKIDAPRPLPFVKFGDSTRTRVGDWVIAIGNPFGLGGTLTAGVVSALHRNTGQGGAYDRYIQTDASINQGNSGGPMFDLNGNVIGINNMIFSPTGGNVGIGFAIPAEQAWPIVQQLKSGGGTVARGWLGVGIQPLDEGIADSLGLAKNRGELISRVEPGQPAEKAGIRQGDIIVKVAGQEVTPDETLSYIVASQKIGARVPIELIRDGRRQNVVAIITQRPPEDQLAALGNQEPEGLEPEDDNTSAQASRASLGIAVLALTPDIRSQLGIRGNLSGLVINSIDPSSDAAQKGLQRGDVILSVNYRPVASANDLNAAATAARSAGRNNVLLQIQRGNVPPRYVAVRVRQS